MTITREEAKKYLIIPVATSTEPSAEYLKQKAAYDMAISALEQEPTDDATLKDIFCTGCEYKEQEPCDDAISREAVLENAWTLEYPDASSEEVVSVKDIRKLPSVQPSRKGHCNSCIYWRRWIDTDVTFCELTEHEMSKDDFCSKYESEVTE